MAKLKIKNIGPIRDGLDSNNGYINFRGITIFLGRQGSGKSIIAKIYSTLSWIEKALVRGDFSPSYLMQYNRFKKQFDYQNISNYFTASSLIKYEGDAFNISYSNQRLEIRKKEDSSVYNFPKIMYVPAERNFITTVDRPDLVKRLPMPLYTFLKEYDAAKQSNSESINLPIGNVKFEYRKQSKKSLLVGDGYKIDLLEASSGFQSLVPLYLVTKYLSQIIKHKDDNTYNESSFEEEKRLRKEIDKILESNNISKEVKLALLEKLSSRFKYSCFINIVEEPEQNLYPLSQKEILFELLKFNNQTEANNLVITTHSPYIINYLTLAIKAFFVKQKLQGNSDLLASLIAIVPLESATNNSKVNIYELFESGDIKKLADYNGLPSDENFLNSFLAESNELFVKLMEIEDLCQ